MSKTISFRDLKLIPELSHYNEIELIHPNLDETVKKYLGQLGFDTDYEIQYVPSKHRDMQGKIAVGFQAVGEISINRNFINSPLCDVTDRMVAASYADPSLTREMAGMMGSSTNYQSLLEDDAVEDSGEYDAADVEDDYEWVMTQIKQLEMVRDQVRGTSQP